MADGWSAAAQALGRMGEVLQNSAFTLNELDAKQKADAAELQIASRIEAFKRGLLSDPDCGTPGQNDGYMAKWQDEVAGINEMIQGIDNPLARKAVQNSFGQLSATQTSAVYQLQYDKWGENARAQRLDMIRTMVETSGMPVDQLLDSTAENLDFLVGANLMDRYDRDKLMAEWSQIITERDLTARAKQAYTAGGLPAAQKLILDDDAIYTAGGTPYRAGDATKSAALKALEDLDTVVNAEANTDFEAAWARMVSAERYGTAPGGPVLSVSYIQNFTTKDGLAPGAKLKEYWLGRLESYYNGKDTGSGTSAAASARLWLGQAEKVVGALRRTKGGVLAGSAGVSVVNPMTGKVITSGVDRSVLDALGKDPEFVRAMDAAGTWNDWNTLLDSIDKPMGAGDTEFDRAKKALEGKPLGSQLLEELRSALNGPLANSTPDQIRAFVDEKILGKAYDVKIGQLFDSSWTGNRYKDGVDLFARDLVDGMFDGLVIRDEQGRGKITNPLYAPAYNKAIAEVQGGLAQLGIKTTAPAITDTGAPWFEGSVRDLKDAPATRPPTKDEQELARRDRSAPKTFPIGAPQSVAYSLVPVTADRDARYLRDIVYAGNYHVLQTYEVIDGKGQWVDVFQAATGKGGYYQYRDMGMAEKVRKAGQKAAAASDATNPYTAAEDLH